MITPTYQSSVITPNYHRKMLSRPSTTYRELKEKVACSLAASDRYKKKLDSLKEKFEDEINSPRRSEKITTLGELLVVLEIRDVISEYNVEPLKTIVQDLGVSNSIMSLIDNYEPNGMQTHNQDFNDVPLPQNTLLVESNPLQSYRNTNTRPMDIKRTRIYDAVTERIGSSWCRLGRKLKIRECDIIDIDKKYDKLYDKAAKIIELYDMKADRSNWFLILCHALNSAMREDITSIIQEIMMMNV